MTKQHSALGDELTLPTGTRLPNRIVKSPTSEALADRVTGAPGEALVNLYRRWGAGGAGLLITGNVSVDYEGRTEPGVVVIRDRRDLGALRRWADAAQAEGAHLWMQINHAGRQTPRRISRRPVAPSPITVSGFAGLFAKPRPLTDSEIVELVQRWATAAAVAKEAGFAGVQIHGAHGYLVSQFLSPRTNRREDRWGGDLAGRMRFLVEIVRAIRAAVGPKFPIGVKLNSADFQRGGFSEDESMQVVRTLEAEGIDLLEISGGSYEQSVMMGGSERASTVAREAYFLDYAEQIRKQTKLPLLLTGGHRTRASMEQIIASKAVDMVGMARPLIVEPELPRQLIEGHAERASSPKTKVGIRMFDDMLQIAWYQSQLHRMAKRLDPDPRLGRWRALYDGFVNSYAFNPFAGLVPGGPAIESPS